MGNVLALLVTKGHIKLGQGFLIFAGLGLFSAVLSLIAIPSKEEFEEKAAIALASQAAAEESPPENPPKRTFWKDLKDTWDVIKQHIVDNTLFFVASVTAYI